MFVAQEPMIESVEAIETQSKKHDDFDNVFCAQEEKLKVCNMSVHLLNKSPRIRFGLILNEFVAEAIIYSL